jgi:hypothetical protein
LLGTYYIITTYIRRPDLKFAKKLLIELAYKGDPEGFEVIEDILEDITRWSSIHRLVFKYEDKFYATRYSQGLTESQDESPFEYAEDEVICSEVKPVQITYTAYL